MLSLNVAAIIASCLSVWISVISDGITTSGVAVVVAEIAVFMSLCGKKLNDIEKKIEEREATRC